MFAKRDVIAGYYGFNNFGDDLFREILSKSLSEQPWANLCVTQNTAEPLAKVTRNLRAVRNILKARSLTLGGGSILGARPPFGIRHIEMSVLPRRKAPYCAIGVGLLEGLGSQPDNIMSRMTWIGLRSKAEYAALSKTYDTVRYVSDLAYAAPQMLRPQATDENDKNEIAVIPAGVGELGKTATSQSWVESWFKANIVKMLPDASGVKILLLQPDNADDTALCALFEKVAKAMQIPVRQVVHVNALDTMQELANARFVFTDRLHGAIVAHIFRVPFRLSKHHKKCDDLLRDLKHPDIDSTRSIANLSADDMISDVLAWDSTQESIVKQHSDFALSGIADWLAHLEQRVV